MLEIPLSEPELERYERQLLLKQWPLTAQLALKKMSVGISASLKWTARYLVAAGVGRVVLLSDEEHPQLVSELHDLNPFCEVTSRQPPNDEKLDVVVTRRGDISGQHSEKLLEVCIGETKTEIFFRDDREETPARVWTSNSEVTNCSIVAESFSALFVMRLANHTKV